MGVNTFVKSEIKLDVDELPDPDFSDFSEDMFYRPMQGNLFKTLPVELARGCPFECAFCSEPQFLRDFSKNFFRQKSTFSEVFEFLKKNRFWSFFHAYFGYRRYSENTMKNAAKHYLNG